MRHARWNGQYCSRKPLFDDIFLTSRLWHSRHDGFPPTQEYVVPVNVQFSLLGPVRAWRSPAELDIGSSRQRAILALLLVRANRKYSEVA